MITVDPSQQSSENDSENNSDSKRRRLHVISDYESDDGMISISMLTVDQLEHNNEESEDDGRVWVKSAYLDAHSEYESNDGMIYLNANSR